jgi:hypothetical protein
MPRQSTLSHPPELEAYAAIAQAPATTRAMSDQQREPAGLCIVVHLARIARARSYLPVGSPGANHPTCVPLDTLVDMTAVDASNSAVVPLGSYTVVTARAATDCISSVRCTMSRYNVVVCYALMTLVKHRESRTRSPEGRGAAAATLVKEGENGRRIARHCRPNFGRCWRQAWTTATADVVSCRPAAQM